MFLCNRSLFCPSLSFQVFFPLLFILKFTNAQHVSTAQILQGLSLNLALKYSEEAARTHRWAGTEVCPDRDEAESEKELVKATSVNSPSRRNSAKDAI